MENEAAEVVYQLSDRFEITGDIIGLSVFSWVSGFVMGILVNHFFNTVQL